MKHTIRLFILILISPIFFSSCEKVIDVNLNDSSPQLVIEGNISDDGKPCIVSITKTVDFDQSNIFPGVEGAVITLSDDAGNTENLQMTTSGIYASSAITGVEGRTYTLNVNVEGNTYKAISHFPYKINLDSIFIDSLSFLGGTVFTVTPQYRDSLGIKNYYRFKLFVNDTADKIIFVDNDEFTDGRTVTRPLFGNLEIETGDSIRLQMMCIDNPVYLYFFSLAQVQDGSSGAPANPVSNFSGGCLGYFSAHSIQERAIVIE